MKKHDAQDVSEQIALFRYEVIADFVHLPPGTKGLYSLIKKKTSREYDIPGSRRTRVAEETIRSWLKKYRKNGFDGLLSKVRIDRGKARRMPVEVAGVLLTVKEVEPDLTVPLVIKKARASGAIADEICQPESTVYKLLARHSLTRKKTQSKDYRSFSCQYAGELFMRDVMHGPAVKVEGSRKRKTRYNSDSCQAL